MDLLWGPTDHGQTQIQPNRPSCQMMQAELDRILMLLCTMHGKAASEAFWKAWANKNDALREWRSRSKFVRHLPAWYPEQAQPKWKQRPN